MMRRLLVYCAEASILLAHVASAIGEVGPDGHYNSEYVRKLTDATFEDFVHDHPYTLVKFYAPWCGHCKAVAKPFAEAAEEVVKGQKDVAFADVDATAETGLADKYGISGYPTFRWFHEGHSNDYPSGRTKEAFVEFVRKRTKHHYDEVKTDNELADELKKRAYSEATYVYEGGLYAQATAEDVAKAMKGTESQHLYFKRPKDHTETITVYKGVSEKEVHTLRVHPEMEKDVEREPSLDRSKVEIKWSKGVRTPWFGEITEHNYEIYAEGAKHGIVWMCLEPQSYEKEARKYELEVIEAAKKHPKYPWVFLDAAEFNSHARDELGCKNFPTIVFQRGDLLTATLDPVWDRFLRDFSGEPDQLTAATLDQWMIDISKGRIKPERQPEDDLDDLDDELLNDDDGDEMDELDESETKVASDVDLDDLDGGEL